MVNHRSPPIASDGPRILVIEDEPLIAQMIEEMLQETGYRVSGVAHTMAMARQEFLKRNFDAVLFDLHIDGRYRPEIADFLLDKGVPFAFVTGYDYFVDAPPPDGAHHYEKPFTAVDLRALLEEPSRVGITDRRNRADRISTSMRVPASIQPR